MKKLQKSGFISWCRVRIIVGHLDASLQYPRPWHPPGLQLLLDANTQVPLVGTVGAPESRREVARPTAKYLSVLQMTRGFNNRSKEAAESKEMR